MAKLSIFSHGFPLQRADLKNDPPTLTTNPPWRSRAYLVPRRLSLSMKMCAQRKAGRRQRVILASPAVCNFPMVTCALSSVTRVSRSPLANEAPEEEADFV